MIEEVIRILRHEGGALQPTEEGMRRAKQAAAEILDEIWECGEISAYGADQICLKCMANKGTLVND